MSRHEGVSCDSCLKGNFRGRRYKCLICYDYDLCTPCYETGAITTQHNTEHPMQCILTRSDFELYFSGEGLTEQLQSFTCPFCGRMGFSELTLQEHVTSDHADAATEVVCPICASQPGGDPHMVTEDLAGHLALEHRPSSRDLISFLDDPSALLPGAGSAPSGTVTPGTALTVATAARNMRRIPHPARGNTATRGRRSNNMHFGTRAITLSDDFFNSANSITLAPSRGDSSVDPIAELLSQLSGVRRSNQSGSASAQLHQLQMQLQLERQQVRAYVDAQAARQQNERISRRQVTATSANVVTSSGNSNPLNQTLSQLVSNSMTAAASASSTKNTESNVVSSSTPAHHHSQLMLTKLADTGVSDAELEQLVAERADRSLFVQEILLSTLMGNEPQSEETDNGDRRSSTVRERPSSYRPPPTPSVTSNSTSAAEQQPRARPRPTRVMPVPAQRASTAPVPQVRTMIPVPRGNGYDGGGGSSEPPRRKPLCAVDALNQTASEPPASH